MRPAKATRLELLLFFDILGTITILGALLCFSLALEWGGINKPWSSADVIGTVIGSLSLTILFPIVQWRQGERTFVIPRVIYNKEVWVLVLVSFSCGSPGSERKGWAKICQS